MLHSFVEYYSWSNFIISDLIFLVETFEDLQQNDSENSG